MEDLLQAAIQKEKEGNSQEAISLFKTLLQKEPDHLQALVWVGKLYLQANKPNSALSFFRQAKALAPENLEVLNYIGRTYIKQKRLRQARSLYEELLKRAEYVPALLNLAKIEKMESRLNESKRLYQKALSLEPDSEIAMNNLGNICQQQGKSKEAVELFQKAVHLHPLSAKLRVNYGNMLFLEEKLEMSLEQYQKALELQPGLFALYKNIAELYSRLLPYEKAMAEIEKIYSAGIRLPQILLTAGILAINNKDFRLVIQLLKKNIELFPNHFESLYQLGIAYHQCAYFKKALGCYEKAYGLNQGNDLLLYAMAKVYADLKEDEKSAAFLKKALKANPENHAAQHELIRAKLNICDWSTRSEDQKKLKETCLKQIESSSQAPIPFLNLNYFEQDNAFLLACSQHTANNTLKQALKQKQNGQFKQMVKAKPKLRIGYLSPDFRDHPTGRVCIDFISAHAKEQFEVFCFSLIADLPNDKIQHQFKASCDHYISLYNVPTRKAVEIICGHQIDILMDLAGYTTYSHPEVLALQPAPIQCQMIGFPGTMGAPFVQYIIGDDVLIPVEHEAHYAEKIVRLPHGFPGAFLEVDEKKVSRADFNLPTDKFIYCCFNSQYKYSPEVYDAWMEILRAVPNSILLLKNGHAAYKDNIRKETQARKVEANRVYFAENLPFAEYMARNKVCDLFLDTLNYTGGSTTINALQMGLPVLTCLGQTNASRMGASIVSASAYSNFVCKDLEEYKRTAIQFGQAPEKIQKIKSELGPMMLNSLLFNARAFTEKLEQGFTEMWESLLGGKTPKSIKIK